jgi:hypothetical protein
MFRLVPAGTVSGRVSDSTGEPVSSIIVQLLKSTYDANGQRRFQPMGAARTDDRGEYRIYWVTPGRYFVNASPTRNSVGIGIPTGNEVTDPGFAITYYPGASDPAAASAIDVPAGSEVNAIDFTLERQRLFRIRGSLLDSRTGTFPRSAALMLLPRDPTMGVGLPPVIGFNNFNNANGTFELRDVAPGAYTLRAESSGMPGESNTQRFSVQAAVDVTKDIDNLVLTIKPGITISGRLTVDGGLDPSLLPNLDQMRVFLSPVPALPIPGGASPGISPDGAFKIANIQPGRYRINVLPMPQGLYLKQATLGQADAVKLLSVNGPVSESLHIVISPKAGQIEGTIIDEDGKPVPGVQAVLIPDRDRDRRDLYKTGSSDQTGHFVVRSVVPGDYKLFAWEDIEPFAYNDPEILGKFEEQGTPLKIAELSAVKVHVRIIPGGQN